VAIKIDACEVGTLARRRNTPKKSEPDRHRIPGVKKGMGTIGGNLVKIFLGKEEEEAQNQKGEKNTLADHTGKLTGKGPLPGSQCLNNSRKGKKKTYQEGRAKRN